jgi:hypothetical protein
VSNPVQTLLFANLAPNYDVFPSKLKSEYLDRSSFDLDDKVMEMTPQGYQRYLRFSEAP